MADDRFTKPSKLHQSMRRQLGLLSSHVKALQFDSRSQNFINAIDRNHQLTRVALGPVADFRRFLLAKSVPGIASQLESIRLLGETFENTFRLPNLSETDRLLDAVDVSRTVKTLSSCWDHVAELQQAIEAMSSPWLNTANEIRSLTGFVGLQEIGRVLRTKPLFDLQSSNVLRLYLGDWRGTIDCPERSLPIRWRVLTSTVSEVWTRL